MDVYSSLLNLNFMASLRSGNLIIDLLIAMMIPIVSSSVANFFQSTWPDFLNRYVAGLFSSRTQTRITNVTHPDDGGYQRIRAELDHNNVLVDAVKQFVSLTSDGTSTLSSVEFKRTTRTLPPDTTLADILRKHYRLVVSPGTNFNFEVGNGVTYCFAENTDEDGNALDRHQQDEKSSALTTTKPKPHADSLFLIDTRPGVVSCRDDVVFALAKDAFEWYRQHLSRPQSTTERYLYQPMLEGGGPIGGEANEADVGIMKCQRYLLSRQKTFNSLFFPEKERLMELVRQFEGKQGKFAVPGFPHKMVLLLYGPPGTGKTSLVKAIADFTKRSIVAIPLSRVRTNKQLRQYMYDTICEVTNTVQQNHNHNGGTIRARLRTTDVIYMLEDVDAASEIVLRATLEEERRRAEERKEKDAEDAKGNKRRRKRGKRRAAAAASASEEGEREREDEEGEGSEGEGAATTTSQAVSGESPAPEEAEAEAAVDRVVVKDATLQQLETMDDRLCLRGLLETLGGMLDAPGRIIIMTTNHIEHLDEALLRPGVVTMKLHMGTFTAACAVDMVRHYFGVAYAPGGACHSPGVDGIPEELLRTVAAIVEAAKGGECVGDPRETRSGFSPAELEQMCAEHEDLESLIAALKKGHKRDVF